MLTLISLASLVLFFQVAHAIPAKPTPASNVQVHAKPVVVAKGAKKPTKVVVKKAARSRKRAASFTASKEYQAVRNAVLKGNLGGKSVKPGRGKARAAQHVVLKKAVKRKQPAGKGNLHGNRRRPAGKSIEDALRKQHQRLGGFALRGNKRGVGKQKALTVVKETPAAAPAPEQQASEDTDLPSVRGKSKFAMFKERFKRADGQEWQGME